MIWNLAWGRSAVWIGGPHSSPYEKNTMLVASATSEAPTQSSETRQVWESAVLQASCDAGGTRDHTCPPLLVLIGFCFALPHTSSLSLLLNPLRGPERQVFYYWDSKSITFCPGMTDSSGASLWYLLSCLPSPRTSHVRGHSLSEELSFLSYRR